MLTGYVDTSLNDMQSWFQNGNSIVSENSISSIVFTTSNSFVRHVFL